MREVDDCAQQVVRVLVEERSKSCSSQSVAIVVPAKKKRAEARRRLTNAGAPGSRAFVNTCVQSPPR